MTIKKIDHLAIVVADLEKALQVYQDGFGLTLHHVSEESAEQVKVAYLPMPEGQGEIELIQPTTPDSGVAKFLSKRGEGLHHICLEVDNLTTSIQEMTAHGLEVLGAIRTNQRGDQYVFIHPKSAHGVLVELYERA